MKRLIVLNFKIKFEYKNVFLYELLGDDHEDQENRILKFYKIRYGQNEVEQKEEEKTQRIMTKEFKMKYANDFMKKMKRIPGR